MRMEAENDEGAESREQEEEGGGEDQGPSQDLGGGRGGGADGRQGRFECGEEIGLCLLCLGTVELGKGPQRIYLLQEWTLVNSAHGLLLWISPWWMCESEKNAEKQLCDSALRSGTNDFNAPGSRWHFSVPNAVWFAISDC